MDFEIAPHTPPEARPAATVVVFRRAPGGGVPELLMLVRSRQMSFVGGAAVFPGGKVDPADYELAGRIAGLPDPDEAAHRIAAIRETLEETGLAIGLAQRVGAEDAATARAMLHDGQTLATVLDRFGWSLALDALTPFARWMPHFKHKPIFDTRFYLADLGTGAVELAADGTENTRLFWASAQEALDMAHREEITAIFPTRRNLERLALFDSFDAARAHAETTPVHTVTPWIEERDGENILRIREDVGYPVCWGKLSEAAK
ncbi:MAG: NUDIX domain-containing protein [Novosphingobium sp.]|nr:NUDIX domain-containing protein [Novosphingobium sp.]